MGRGWRVTRAANRCSMMLDFGAIAREILAGAKAIDEAENELYGEARGDELPEQLRTRKARGVFRRAREQRDRQRDASKPNSGLAPDDDPQDRSTLSGSSRAGRAVRGGGARAAASSTGAAVRPLIVFAVT